MSPCLDGGGGRNGNCVMGIGGSECGDSKEREIERETTAQQDIKIIFTRTKVVSIMHEMPGTKAKPKSYEYRNRIM